MPNLTVPVQGVANALATSLDLDFAAGMLGAKPWHGEIADTRPHKGKTVIIPWTDPAKKFEKFLGPNVTNPWTINAIQTTSEPWKDSLDIDRDEMLENVYMDYRDAGRSMGEQAAMLPCDMVALALRTGGSSFGSFTWYDGKPAFAEDHPVDPRGNLPGTWRNLFKGKPFSEQSILEVWEAMAAGVMMPNGRHVSVMCNKVGVSGANFAKARKFLENSMVIQAIQSAAGPAAAFGATDNVWKGVLTPVLMETLSEVVNKVPGELDVWYMWDDRRVKPVRYYEIKKPTTTPLFSDTDAYLRTVNKYLYMGEAHGVAVVRAPWFIARVEPGVGP